MFSEVSVPALGSTLLPTSSFPAVKLPGNEGGHLHLLPRLKTSGVTPPFTLKPLCSDAELEN